MPSLRTSPVTTQTTPEWLSRPPTKTRTVAQRKVYGKRKVDAPRAVFDNGSPKIEVEKSKKDALENVQARLAEIRIQDESTHDGDSTDTVPNESGTLKSEQENEVAEVAEGPKPEDLCSSMAALQLEETHVEALPMRNKPKKRYDKMLEVRIPPRLAMPRKERQSESENSAESKKRSTRKKPSPRLSSGCINDEKATAYVRPILHQAISPLAAQGVQKFSSWAARGRNLFEVVKLAEGSYGEVYKLRLREDVCKREISKAKLARLREYGDGVFKIVPLRAQRGPGSRKFTSVDEIVAEAKMLKYLDPIPGFARFRDIHVVQGRFPETFQAAWDHYKDSKDDCLNPNPSSKSAYRDSQLWAIVEMDDAGCELEKFSWSSIFQIYDIFWGVAMALARAEEYAMFEVSPLAELRSILTR